MPPTSSRVVGVVIGRLIIRRIAREGAKNIILISCSGPDQKGISKLVEELQTLDVKVFVDRCNVADLSQVKPWSINVKKRGHPSGALFIKPWLFETRCLRR